MLRAVAEFSAQQPRVLQRTSPTMDAFDTEIYAEHSGTSRGIDVGWLIREANFPAIEVNWVSIKAFVFLVFQQCF